MVKIVGRTNSLSKASKLMRRSIARFGSHDEGSINGANELNSAANALLQVGSLVDEDSGSATSSLTGTFASILTDTGTDENRDDSEAKEKEEEVVDAIQAEAKEKEEEAVAAIQAELRSSHAGSFDRLVSVLHKPFSKQKSTATTPPKVPKLPKQQPPKQQQQQQQQQPQQQRSPPPQSSESSPDLDVKPIVPKLDSIPRLLLEDMMSSNRRIVEDAFDILARRLRRSEEMREETFRAGGHAILVMAMRQWRDSEAIQAGGCRCITNMTCQFPEAKRSFAMIGGVESTIVAMQKFPKSLQVQGYGCGALMNILCGGSDKGDNEDDDDEDLSKVLSERFVNDLNGIAIVVEAMKQFPKDPKIQLGGCGLFQNLAQEKAFIYQMMQAGAVSAVGTALQTNPGDPNIKKAAGSFMKKVFA